MAPAAPLVDLFLYVKPLIFGPLASPTTPAGHRRALELRTAWRAPSSPSTSRTGRSVTSSPSRAARRRAGRPRFDPVLLAAGFDHCIHARAPSWTFGEPGDGSGTRPERPDLGLGAGPERPELATFCGDGAAGGVADDNLLVREGVVKLLDHQEGIEVVGTCGTYDELMDAAAGKRPTSSSPTSGCRRPAPTRASGPPSRSGTRSPAIGVVVLSQYVGSGVRARAARAGLGRPGVPAQGAGLRPEPDRARHRRGRARRQRHRPGRRRGAGRGRGPLGTASPRRPAHPTRAGSARADGPGPQQRRDRPGAVPLRTGRREAHQLAVLEARTWARKPTSTAG